MLWPDGEVLKPPTAPEGYHIAAYHDRDPLYLDDGRFAWGADESDYNPEKADLYLTAEGEDVTDLTLAQTSSCPGCLMLPDGRLLLPNGSVRYIPDELIGPRGPAAGFYDDAAYNRLDWPTIRDPETGKQWPVRLPTDVLRPGYILQPLAIQQGPFLRVVDVGESCLRIRTELSRDSAELACMAERVLLTDLHSSGHDDSGTSWRKVRTPSGIEGWAEGRYLGR